MRGPSGKLRDAVGNATEKITATTETIARAIGVAVGIAVLGLAVAVVALMMAAGGRARLAAAT